MAGGVPETQVAALEIGIAAALVDIVGAEHARFDLVVRRRYGCRLTDLFFAVPDAVVFPASTGEVSELMRGAAACAVSIVHRSAAPIPGGAVLVAAGGIVLSLERMDRIIDVDLATGIARIQPYTTGEQLRSATGFPRAVPALASFEAGGDSLTSSGPILGVEAVLPNGEIVRTGVGLLARDLLDRQLAAPLARQDGALALITELTVCLDTSDAYPYIGLAYFQSVATACRAARTVMMSERTPVRVNFLDRRDIGRVEDGARLGLRRDAEALLMFTGADRSTGCREPLREISATCADAGAIDPRVFEDAAWCASLQRAIAQFRSDNPR